MAETTDASKEKDVTRSEMALYHSGNFHVKIEGADHAVSAILCGLEAAKTLLYAVGGFGDPSEVFPTQLQGVFTGGKAAWAASQMVSTKDREETKVKLARFLEEVRKMEASQQEKFASLNEDKLYQEVKDKIEIPTQILFDQVLNCWAYFKQNDIERFLTECHGEHKPMEILKTLLTFIRDNEDPFEQSVRAWREALHHHSIRLMVVVMFFYGVLGQQGDAEREKLFERDAENVVNDMIPRLKDMFDNLNKIEYGEEILEE